MPLHASVGKNGINRPEDVRYIQNLLNRVLPHLGGALKSIAVDGICGLHTIAAITQFQKLRTAYSDGRIDPGGPTFLKLIHEAGQSRHEHCDEVEHIISRMDRRYLHAYNEGVTPADLEGRNMQGDLAALARLAASAPGQPSAKRTGLVIATPLVAIEVLVFLIFIALILAMFASMPRPPGAVPNARERDFVRRLTERAKKEPDEADATDKEMEEDTTEAAEFLEERVEEWKRELEKCRQKSIKLGGCTKEMTAAIAALLELTTQIGLLKMEIQFGRWRAALHKLNFIIGRMRQLMLALRALGQCATCANLMF